MSGFDLGRTSNGQEYRLGRQWGASRTGGRPRDPGAIKQAQNDLDQAQAALHEAEQ
jgi:hypothetical protein